MIKTWMRKGINSMSMVLHKIDDLVIPARVTIPIEATNLEFYNPLIKRK